MPSKPSFGIVFLPQFPPESLVDYARQAEAAGFDTLWLYEDCFYAGAFTSAATILAGTGIIRVGIGLLPATVRNPLFAAMEITTLACLYPGRFIPGFGHGWEPWMKQIGVYPKSTMKALEETVTAVRSLLSGEETTLNGTYIYLDRVKQLLLPQQVPPVYVGAIREKTLRLAGQIGDGTILSALSSPAYVRWAGKQITAGAAGSKLSQNILSVGVACKVNPDGVAARAPVRRWLAENIQDGGPHLIPLGIEEEARGLFKKYDLEEGAQKIPEDWIDALSASGTPQQALAAVEKLVDAGADEVVLTPVDLDPAPMQETIRHFMPVLKELRL